MKKKISLSKIRVSSFITTIDEEPAQQLNGGGFLSLGRHCTHAHNGCQTNTDGLFCGSGTHGCMKPQG